MSKTWELIIVNIITLIRVIGIFLILALFDKGGVVIGTMTIFLYLTDVLDGLLARKWECATFLGALLDGVADKLLTLVNFILLYLIAGEIVLIPIIIEILICIVQFIKYKLNLNIQSNKIGKLKVWVLAISIVLTYFVSGPSITNKTIYSITLAPAIFAELFTLLSYLLEFLNPTKLEKTLSDKNEVEVIKLKGKDRWTNIKNIWLNPEFYHQHKDEDNLRDLRLESRKEV